MPPFKFSLEHVLRYREQLEEQAKQELSRCLAEYQASVEREKDNESKLLEVEKTLFDGATAMSLSDADRWLYTNYHMCLKNDAYALAAQTKACDMAVNVARAALVERAQEHRLLEKIRQKKLEQYNHEEKLREQREIDAITTTRRPVPAFGAVSSSGDSRVAEASSRSVVFS